MGLDEYKKRMSWLSSHSAIEGMLIKFLISNGWQELSSKPYKLLHLPDRVFIKSNVKLLAEVKPGTARWDEIKKGLGQVLSLLATKNGIPILVCSASWHDDLMRVLEPLNESIWLLLFTDDKCFIPVIGNFLE